MANYNPIDVSLCRRIAFEEWRKFQVSQDKAIEERLKRETGLLHAGGGGRKYSISTNQQEIVAHLIHPDYERYQDMRKLRHGRGVKEYEARTGRTAKREGRKIHNKLIWGRMNTIAFRCFNDIRGEVIKYVRSSRFALKQENITKI